MATVNWRRGFFRAWLVFTALWAIAVIAIGVSVSINPYVAPKAVATLTGGTAPEMFPTYGQPVIGWLAAIQAGEMKATDIGDGFTLYTSAGVETQRLADRLVEAKILVNDYIAGEKAARRTENAINTAFWTLVPPLVLLVLGWAIGWILSGFRRTA